MGGEFQLPAERVEKGSDGKNEDVMAGARAEAIPLGDTQTAQVASGDATQGAAFAASFADSNAFGGAAAEQALKNMKQHLDPEVYAFLEWSRQDPDAVKKLLNAGSKSA